MMVETVGGHPSITEQPYGEAVEPKSGDMSWSDFSAVLKHSPFRKWHNLAW